jgi:hypothetical protein
MKEHVHRAAVWVRMLAVQLLIPKQKEAGR